MKKLFLTALTIIGLMSSSAQGAASMAAGFGATAWKFLQASAVPVTLASMGYEVGKMYGSSSELVQQVGTLNGTLTQQVGTLNSQLDQYLKPVFTSPRLLRLAGILPNDATTWYGKLWNGLCYADDVTDGILSKVSKVMTLLSVFGAVRGLAHAEPTYAQAANIVPQPESVDQNIVEQQPVVFKPHKAYHRRSRIAARA